jgi:putative MATE family efflux protein
MKSNIDFIGGSTRKSLMQMVIPLLCAMILTMAYNLVDSLWVGNLLGESGYAALTNSTAIVLILSAIAMGASNGIAILVSQTVGANNMQKANGIISTLLIISAVFSVGVTVVLEIILRPILRLMNTPEELFEMAYTYLSIYLLGYAAIYLYMQFTAVFRSFGDPIFQMKGMLISTIFNAVLDPVLIHLMGLGGAAWATVLSEVLCLLFAIAYHNKKHMFTLNFKQFSGRYILPLLTDAIPAAIQGCMPAISSATMLFLVTRFGVTTIAAYGVTNKLEILLFYPAMAMNMGLTTIAGQCMGASRLDRLKDYMKCALRIGCISIAVITILVMTFARQLSFLFINSTEAASIVKQFFLIVSIGYVMYMITSCFLGEISGLGKPGMSMLLFFVYYIVIRIPLACVLVNSSLGMSGIWTAILISHIAAAVLAFVQTMHITNRLKNVESKIIQNIA